MPEVAGSSHSKRLVPSGGVIHLVRALEESGVDFSSIRQALSLDFSRLTAENSRIEAGRIPEIYQLAMQLDVPGGFWLKLGDSFSVYNWHLELSNWILTGKNFAELMPKLQGLYGVAPGSSDEAIREAALELPADDEGHVRMPVTSPVTAGSQLNSAAELSAATLLRGMKSLLGEQDIRLRFYFDYAEPGYGDCYREVLGPDVYFDASCSEVHIPRHYIYQTFLSSDAVMHQYYEEQLQELFEPDPENTTLVGKVEAILLDHHGNFPSMIQICAALDVGERTLRRSLQKQGTSYRELLLDTKMKRAEYYLQHTDISIEEIAYRLDYSDYANFRRAFQARYGESPSSFRKQHVGGQ